MRPAGFWIRFAASFIDTLIIAVPLMGLVYLLSGGEWLNGGNAQERMASALAGDVEGALRGGAVVARMQWELVFELLMAVVVIFFWKRWAGATPGKRVLGLQVVDAQNGGPIDNKQAIVRYIGYIVSTLPLLGGFLMVAFRKDKRALHDLMAGTSVVYNSK